MQRGVKRTKRTKRTKARPKVVLDVGKLDGLVDKAEREPLQKEECAELKSAIHLLAAEVARQGDRPSRATEKAKKLLEEYGSSLAAASTQPVEGDGQSPSDEKPKRKGGNGRHPAADYTGATEEKSPLPEEQQPKKSCPACLKGKLYRQDPSPLLRITGMPPIQAKVYLMEKTRCNLCGEIFTAPVPEGIGDDKYDCSVAAMLAILKYSTGMPFKRMETLQKHLGVPLPASTQFELLDEAAAELKPVHMELVRQGAQGRVATYDDTRAQILDEVERPEEQDEDRTGIKTTGIVVELDDDKKVAIFVTGPRHAGENMTELLKQRQEGLDALVGMADALSHNNPKEVPPGVELLPAVCLTHGRRQFVDIFENFPEDCWYVIEQLGLVYHHDKQCRDQGLSKDERLKFHQEKSGPVMDALKKWMESQFSEKKTEPNSGLGKAIKYFLKRWDRLTLFLHHPGSPLDSTVVERALKKAILNRRNSFFFKTQHGAEVADLYLTLIHTCELNKVNPFNYILQLLRHAPEVARAPADWLPWNFHLQLGPL